MSDVLEIPEFLRDLEDRGNRRNFEEKPENNLMVINMKNPDMHGNISVIPVSGKDKYDQAIVQINKIGRITELSEGTKRDGSKYVRKRKLHFFFNPKYYGELNEEQLAKLEKIKSKFNTATSPSFKVNPKVATELVLSVHSVTLIQGIAVKHTRKNENDKVIFKNVPALYVFESKNFEKKFKEAIENQNIKCDNDISWLLNLISNDSLRKRYININYYLDKKDGIGYSVAVTFEKFDEDAKHLTDGDPEGYNITKLCDEGTMDKFGNPIKTYLNIAQDQPVFIDDVMDRIDSCLSRYLNPEPTEVADLSDITVSKPDSNANFRDTLAVNSEPNSEPEVEDKAF